MQYVYELINEKEEIEYVGESKNPQQRFDDHTKRKFRPGRAMGKFYGREDLTLNVVAEFNTRKEAYAYQCELQTKYFGINEREIAAANGIKGKPYGHLGWKARKNKV